MFFLSELKHSVTYSEMWTKTSSPPSFGVRNPWPLLRLKLLTVPVIKGLRIARSELKDWRNFIHVRCYADSQKFLRQEAWKSLTFSPHFCVWGPQSHYREIEEIYFFLPWKDPTCDAIRSVEFIYKARKKFPSAALLLNTGERKPAIRKLSKWLKKMKEANGSQIFT